jgi:eukaryotic-like serine/threonine-protein kinase
MASLLETLQAALGAAYVVERELVGGGMARVFVATESALGRHVVIKVLPPELAETVSADRFQREIQVAANLQHPHIVPLLTAGHANGLLYYTMPLVDGETLRGRLAREGELPVPEACRILAEVARALSYAHKQGIVHRDIKPENILLSQGQAQVADFGIAKALAASAADDGNLTTRGLVLGTPAYMAPEQAFGDRSVDIRGDLYSLGVVAYEMLTGIPPFNERSPQAIMAAHALRTPQPVKERRPGVPAGLAQLVMRLLEKDPSERPQNADEVLRRLDAAAVAESATVQFPTRGAATRHRRWLVGGGAALLTLLAVVAGLRGRGSMRVDPSAVAVLPFRVTGADSSLRYLREGMLDLLATKLSGTRNLRTVDPRTLLRAWRRAGGGTGSEVDRSGALEIARTVGAGRLLEGEIIGTPHHMVLNAMLSDPSGRGEVRAAVEGPADSLTSLVDRLAAQLLVLGAGEGQHRLSALTTTSLPALRAYLDGRAAYRRGDFGAARNLFDRAIEFDSSFALAGIGRTMAAIWLGESYYGPGSRLAWRHRARLSGRDLALLQFMLGHKYPYLENQQEGIADAEVLVEAAPDNPEAWAILGDHMYHYGVLVGIPEALERSTRAYKRSLALDSSYAPSLEHLHELHLRSGDTVAAREALALRLRLDSTTQSAAVDRWFARRVLNDSTVRPISLNDDSLVARARVVVRLSLHHGIGLADAESVLAFRHATVSNEAERREIQDLRWTFYVIRGQPKRAQLGMPYPAGPTERAATIFAALYADADSIIAAKVAAEIPRTFTRPTPGTGQDHILEQYAAAQYDLAYGQTKTAREAVRAWNNSLTAQDTSYVLLVATLQAQILDAQIAALAHRPDALARLRELDSVLQSAPTAGEFEPLGNIIAARLWHGRGDDTRALAAVKRQLTGLGLQPINVTALRDEGRYAALAGDREGAIRAYRHYLTLRSDPEPAVRSKVEEVRAELAALERESPDR